MERPHTLALHGWTGLGGSANGDPFTKLYMRQCAVVQIHQPTRDFIALARVALETAPSWMRTIRTVWTAQRAE